MLEGQSAQPHGAMSARTDAETMNEVESSKA
jgi:hypothetical protein